MRSEFVSQEKNRVEIKVEFEASEFNAELNKVFNNISERTIIPGFRKGHVPRKTLEMRFGKNAIHDETIENLLNESISDIMKDYDIEPLFPPSIKSKSAIVDNQPVSVNILIEARPEIKLPDLQDIEVERLISVVDDKAVDSMVDNLRKSQAKVEAVNSPVQDDSVVSVEFNMIVIGADGAEISRNKKKEMATLNMQELPMEEFREPLMGKNLGDFVEITIGNQTIGDSATLMRYELKIIEIGKRIMPELTPEFFKLCMGFDCETEEAFRDAIADRLSKRRQSDVQADAEIRAIDVVAAKSEIEVPGSLVYREMQRIKELDEKDAKEKYKVEFNEILKSRGMDYESYEKQIMARAWRIVRNSLIIEELGRNFEIKIEPQDLDVWIKETAENENIDPELLKKAYFKDKESVEVLVDRAYSDKTIKLLMDKIKIIDVSELTKPVVPEAEEPNKPEETEDVAESETVKPEVTAVKEEKSKKTRKTKKADTEETNK